MSYRLINANNITFNSDGFITAENIEKMPCIYADLPNVLEQEPRKDEVILTKKEYGELVSSEFDNGYAKGYREALEQEDILDKIRAEIKALSNANPSYWHCGDMVEREEVFDIIDKYRTDRS